MPPLHFYFLYLFLVVAAPKYINTSSIKMSIFLSLILSFFFIPHLGIPVGHVGRVEDSGQPLTKLEIGVVGADVVAGAEQPFHHQGRSHGIEQAEVFGDPTFLEKERGGGKKARREGKSLGGGCEDGGRAGFCLPRGLSPQLRTRA